MNGLEIVFSVLVGGILTLLGTLLGNFLQYRLEQRRLKIEIIKERLAEVRRYLITCLEFVDLVSIPTTLGPNEFGVDALAEWESSIEEHYENWRALPVNGSARILFVNDKEILDGLSKIDELKIKFYLNYLNMVDKGKMIQLDHKRDELKEIAEKVGQRLDKILEKI